MLSIDNGKDSTIAILKQHSDEHNSRIRVEIFLALSCVFIFGQFWRRGKGGKEVNGTGTFSVKIPNFIELN